MKVNRRIYLLTSGLDSTHVFAIPYCSAELSKRHNGNRNIVLDHFNCPAQADAKALKKNLRNLERKLSYADPNIFGHLTCKGMVDRRRNQDEQIIFAMVLKVTKEFSGS